MSSWLANIFKIESHTDILMFKVSYEYVEVFALRNTGKDECLIDVLFAKKMPIVARKKNSLHNVVKCVDSLIHESTINLDLIDAGFSVGRARVCCMFVHPLSKIERVVHSAKLKKDIRITLKLLKSVLKKSKEVKVDMERIPEGYAQYNEYIEQVKLNGYPTKKPLNKVAREIEITVAHLFVDFKFLKATGNVIEQNLNREVEYFHMTSTDTIADIACKQIYTDNSLQALNTVVL